MAKKQHKSAAIDIPAVVQAKHEPVSYPTKHRTFNELPGWLQGYGVDELARVLARAAVYREQGMSDDEALEAAAAEIRA